MSLWTFGVFVTYSNSINMATLVAFSSPFWEGFVKDVLIRRQPMGA